MIIAVDPGNTTGAAVYSGPTPAVTIIRNPTNADLRELIGWAVRAAERRRESLEIFVEDQHQQIAHVNGRPVINFEPLKKLVRTASRWKHVAEDFGVPVTWLGSQTWEGTMLKPAPSGTKGKARAKAVVAATWDEVVRFWGTPDAKSKRVLASKVPQDGCDAILLGRYVQLYREPPC